MTPPTLQPRAGRRGITLVEILISILIMGVGLVSLATLFPLGLLRLREASRNSRSGLLAESATAEIRNRNLLSKSSFRDGFSCPWYFGSANTSFTPAIASGGTYDPWKQDGPPTGVAATTGVDRISPDLVTGLAFVGPGLPVCYDPFWLALTGYYGSSNPNRVQARFAEGGTLRPDPNSSRASDYGLQRITNFSVDFPTVPNLGGGTPSSQMLQNIFISPDDIVFNSVENANKTPNFAMGEGYSSVLPELKPDLNTGSVQIDYAYSWFFTGQQVDVTNDSAFSGDIVVCNNRPFGVETSGGIARATGETVVEGIFGYATPGLDSRHPSLGYAPRSSRVVLLRWPASVPDPEIRVGGWIADVTYERSRANEGGKMVEAYGIVNSELAVNNTRLSSGLNPLPLTPVPPAQRCHWYQIVRKGAIEDEINNVTRPPYTDGYRRIALTVGSTLQSLTLLDNTGAPVHVNSALVMPSVVNVFPRVFNSH